MQKIVTIHLQPGIIEGNKVERDVTNIQGIPLGAPANSEYYAQLCQMYAVSGCTHPDQVNADKYTHIAPSQIITVTFEFRK